MWLILSKVSGEPIALQTEHVVVMEPHEREAGTVITTIAPGVGQAHQVHVAESFEALVAKLAAKPLQ